MLLNEELFKKIASRAANSPRLRMNFDLRDSEEENTQRMLNVLLPGSKTQIHRHQDTSEVVICIYGSVIERIYDENGREIENHKIVAGSKTPGIIVDIGKYHRLESTNEMGVVCSIKTGKYHSLSEDDTFLQCNME